MTLTFGFLLVLIAGVLQGTFVLPMTMTKKWQWEHIWGTFSFFGMLLFNWILALIFLPNIFAVYQNVPSGDIFTLMLFGAGWGVGAILFGLAMDKLGMALGYPIIMGLIASLGALIPLGIFFPADLATMKGLVLIAGTALAILGIVLCSNAGSKKERGKDAESDSVSQSFVSGLVIAVLAGVLSCLPNVGVAFGGNVIRTAEEMGISATFAGNAVWALFFTMGFVVNFGYCLYLMIKKGSQKEFRGPKMTRNLGLGMLMAAMWIGSFYLYGMSATKLGDWGVIVGWPLFISLSIIVGNLWGIWKGEWQDAATDARQLLNKGLLVLIAAVIVIAVSNLV